MRVHAREARAAARGCAPTIRVKKPAPDTSSPREGSHPDHPDTMKRSAEDPAEEEAAKRHEGGEEAAPTSVSTDAAANAAAATGV